MYRHTPHSADTHSGFPQTTGSNRPRDSSHPPGAFSVGAANREEERGRTQGQGSVGRLEKTGMARIGPRLSPRPTKQRGLRDPEGAAHRPCESITCPTVKVVLRTELMKRAVPIPPGQVVGEEGRFARRCQPPSLREESSVVSSQSLRSAAPRRNLWPVPCNLCRRLTLTLAASCLCPPRLRRSRLTPVSSPPGLRSICHK